MWVSVAIQAVLAPEQVLGLDEDIMEAHRCEKLISNEHLNLP